MKDYSGWQRSALITSQAPRRQSSACAKSVDKHTSTCTSSSWLFGWDHRLRAHITGCSQGEEEKGSSIIFLGTAATQGAGWAWLKPLLQSTWRVLPRYFIIWMHLLLSRAPENQMKWQHNTKWPVTAAWLLAPRISLRDKWGIDTSRVLTLSALPSFSASGWLGLS